MADTLNMTVPLPLPLAPLVIVSQLVSLLTAVHAHPFGTVTLVEPVPPAAPTVWLVGVRVKVQAAAACETVNVCEAIVTVPVRADAFGFAATLKLAEPLPLPLAPLVTVIQLSLLVADHGQPPGDVTLVEPVPPAAATDNAFEEIEYVHPTPACVTVKVCPATVSVPPRCVELALAVMLKPVDPLPLPVAPLVTVNQAVLLLTAVQVQPVGAVTFVEPLPELALTV